MASSRNAHDRNVLVRHAQSRVRQTPSYFLSLSGLWREGENRPDSVFLAPGTPHGETVVVRRAQVGTKPGHCVNMIQGEPQRNHLDLGPNPGKILHGVLSSVARRLDLLRNQIIRSQADGRARGNLERFARRRDYCRLRRRRHDHDVREHSVPSPPLEALGR